MRQILLILAMAATLVAMLSAYAALVIADNFGVSTATYSMSTKASLMTMTMKSSPMEEAQFVLRTMSRQS